MKQKNQKAFVAYSTCFLHNHCMILLEDFMDINLLKSVYSDLDKWINNKELRYFQKDAVKAVMEALTQDNKLILVEMAPGSGKYLVLVTILQYLFERGIIKKALFLTAYREAANQTIHTISERTYLNVGSNLKQGTDNQIIVTTYNNLIKDKDLFKDYDFVICMDIGFTKNATIIDLFKSVDSNKTYYLGMGDGSLQSNVDNFFSELSPSYKYSVQDTIIMNERKFIGEFLQNLFRYMGYSNLQIEPKVQINNDSVKHEVLTPDMLVYNHEGAPLILIETKTYRSRFVSQVNISGALQQILSYKLLIKSKEYVLILLGEINQDVKLAVYEKFGIHLWDISNLLFLCNNNNELIKSLTEQVPFPILDITPNLITNWEYNNGLAPLFPNKGATVKQAAENLIKRLSTCRTGRSNGSDQEYERICTDIITFLFEAEFTQFSTQHKTQDRIFRMDLLCGLKGTTAFWEFLIRHYNTKFVVFEFKNYTAKITQNLVYITEKYLFNAALRNVAIIVSYKGFQKNATIAAMGCLKESGKLILDITNDDLLNMIELKVDGKEPSDYLLSKVENFLMSVSK